MDKWNGTMFLIRFVTFLKYVKNINLKKKQQEKVNAYGNQGSFIFFLGNQNTKNCFIQNEWTNWVDYFYVMYPGLYTIYRLIQELSTR